jgi:NADH-quinone oxidoreductase subunit G
MHPAALQRLGIVPGDRVSVRQGAGVALVQAAADPAVPEGCVQLSAAHPLTAKLGPMFGQLVVEAAP